MSDLTSSGSRTPKHNRLRIKFQGEKGKVVSATSPEDCFDFQNMKLQNIQAWEWGAGEYKNVEWERIASEPDNKDICFGYDPKQKAGYIVGNLDALVPNDASQKARISYEFPEHVMKEFAIFIAKKEAKYKETTTVHTPSPLEKGTEGKTE